MVRWIGLETTVSAVLCRTLFFGGGKRYDACSTRPKVHGKATNRLCMTFVKRGTVRHVVHVVQNALNGAEWKCLMKDLNAKKRSEASLAFRMSVARLRGQRDSRCGRPSRLEKLCSSAPPAYMENAAYMVRRNETRYQDAT